ncbi:MAG TPA: glycoside hydrolase family 38 C-terminal domain-containing protein [Armatimonadota bacterium]|jgi:alpha-mannosidase
MSDSLRNNTELITAARNAHTQRFLAEIAFVRQLAKVEKKDWDSLIAEAEALFSAGVAGSLEDLRAAVERAEAVLAPIAPIAKGHTVYCVGHGHIDMNWMWGWPETVATTNDTFLTVLKLMDEFPTFKYTQSQASVYEIVRRHNPEIFEGIKKRVKEGRWEIAASHWVEGDKNLASGESLTRHLLYTRRFMKEHFGLEPEEVTVDWSPDTFGHAWSIPSIDARGAVKHYYLCRGGDAPLPPLFWWEGPDGGRILVNREKHWYNSELAPQSAMMLLDFREECGMKDWMQVYGVGDHGGGPTRRDLKLAIEMDSWPVFPNFRFSTTREYFAAIEANSGDFPVVTRELNFEFSGCYTSQSDIKRNNRHGENAVGEAESAAALAFAALGRDYPAETLRNAWVDVLFSHFHDILPGSGVADTRTFNQGTFQKIVAATGMVKTNSLRAVAAAVNTSFAGETDSRVVPADIAAMGLGGGPGRFSNRGEISSAGHVVDGPRPVIVFNPTAWQRDEVVKVSVWDAQTGACPGKLEDKTWVVKAADGTLIPAQRTDHGDYWGHKFVDLAFPANVGPMGYAAYSVEEGAVEGSEPAVVLKAGSEGKDHVNLPAGELTMENEFLKVVFDKASGGIISLLDKRTGKDVADPANPIGLLEYTLERAQGGSAWILGAPEKTVCPLELTSFGVGTPGAWNTDVSANGPYVATVTAKGKIGGSTFTVMYQLKAGQPWVDITVDTRWVEIGGDSIGTPRLSMRFPVNFTSKTALYEIPFGTLEREPGNARDVPALRWADLRSQDAGLAVLNDSKYGHAFDGKSIRVALIRSTCNPDPLPEIGDHTIKFAVAPHGPDISNAELIRLGAGFNHPLLSVPTDVHEGPLPASIGMAVFCAEDNVLVTQLKRAEDSNELVFRLQEAEGKATTVHVTLDTTLFGKVTAAVEADLIERPLTSGTAALAGNGFSVRVDGNGIATVKVACAK